MPAAHPTPIDNLLWTATRYSDVLQVDRRVVAQALETAPSHQHNGNRVWHVREGMRAIYQRVLGVDSAGRKNPNDMEPKEALDYYRAQREKIKLGEDIRQMIPAAHIERIVGETFKSLAQTLDGLPDALERDCGLPPLAVTAAQQAVDVMRETLYANLSAALDSAAHG